MAGHPAGGSATGDQQVAAAVDYIGLIRIAAPRREFQTETTVAGARLYPNRHIATTEPDQYRAGFLTTLPGRGLSKLLDRQEQAQSNRVTPAYLDYALSIHEKINRNAEQYRRRAETRARVAECCEAAYRWTGRYRYLKWAERLRKARRHRG